MCTHVHPGAYHDVPPELMPEHMPKESWDMLSFLTVDEWGKSRLGVHTDTLQLLPCLCANDSLYAPGFKDYSGAELLVVQGIDVG